MANTQITLPVDLTAMASDIQTLKAQATKFEAAFAQQQAIVKAIQTALAGLESASSTPPTSGSSTPPTSGSSATPPTSGSSSTSPAPTPTTLKNYGTAMVTYSALAKPAKGQTVTDPDFGTKITRITDCVADFKNLCMVPAYPTAMAWNCDDSYFVLYAPGETAQAGGQQGWALYDGKTYAFIKFLDINPADIEQFYWDHTDPATLRYIDNHQMGDTYLADLTAINVQTGVKTIVHSFLPNGLPPGYPTNMQGVRCGYPFALGINAKGERIWGLGAFGPSVPNVSGELGVWVFGFNETTKAFTIYDPSVVPQPQARGSTPFASLSGKYFIWNAAKGLESQPTTQSAVLDAVTGKLVRMVDFDTNEHCDTAQNSAGQDLLVGSQFSRNTGGNGNVIVCNLETGVVINVVGESSNPVFGYPVTGSLSGATAWKNPAWVATGMTGNIYGSGADGKATNGTNGNNGPTANPCTLLDQEVMVTNLDTGESFRIAHHRSTGNYSDAPQSNYWAQPNVTFSTDGKRILVQSDWGCGDPSKPTLNPNAAVDTYVIELP